MATADVDEGLKVAEDIADLIALAQKRQTDEDVVATVARVLQRHGCGSRSAVRVALAAKALNVSSTTVRSWLARGVLQQASTGSVVMVTSLSLGRALALVRELSQGDHGPERLLRAIEQLRDRDLLERAREAALQTNPDDLVVYTDEDLAELRS